MKALVGAFNQEKALVGAFSVIVKTGCGTDGSFYSISYYVQGVPADPAGAGLCEQGGQAAGAAPGGHPRTRLHLPGHLLVIQC